MKSDDNPFSDHKELDWKVLDYMISSEMAKMNAQSFVSVASLPIRNADINKVGGMGCGAV
ncbi:hypothetical protein LQV63_31255 [Paenibacillus profundus]|uniref:Uncharacterized protein n=1 Tax=Paenibacillus profundus TaxID=1173085 RepID=A0ABS8YPG6_9BACL|nr:hypothetical protein [Paenibacillus profundus]MCE5173705.1 hypothetical protein [Paenibacillus profundus]